jgi:hypothetical protein
MVMFCLPVVLALARKLPVPAPQKASLLDSEYGHLYVADGIVASASDARRAFDYNFAAPRKAHSGRFAWDYWHVTRRDEDHIEATSPSGEGAGYGRGVASDADGAGQQYTFLRTPAADYFAPALFDQLCDDLCAYGRAQLGCDAITPPWLSLYVDGCSQNFHTDATQGPFAFVLSLTPDGAHAAQDGPKPGWFEGGETTILKPWVTDYWRGYESRRGLEFGSLFESVAPQWNRLTVFDARLPHGVAPVRGTRDPRRGRLVLTGWFSDPQPSVSGALADGGKREAKAMEALEEALTPFQEAMAEVRARDDCTRVYAFGADGNCTLDSLTRKVGRVTGFLAIRLDIRGVDGSVEAIHALCDTLVADPNDYQARAALLLLLLPLPLPLPLPLLRATSRSPHLRTTHARRESLRSPRSPRSHHVAFEALWRVRGEQGAIGEDDEGNTIYEDACADVKLTLQNALEVACFPEAAGESSVTLPIAFE